MPSSSISRRKPNKNSPSRAPQRRARPAYGALDRRLREAIAGERYEEARDLAVELTRRQPGNALGWKVLGVALTHLGQMNEAVSPMKKSVEVAPFDAEAHLNLGTLLHALGQFQDAEASYRKVLEIRPEHAEALNNLGNLLCDMSRPAEAEPCFRQAIVLKPDYVQPYSKQLR